jgi:hypothetical protein
MSLVEVLPFYFMEQFEEHWNYVFFKGLVELSSESI